LPTVVTDDDSDPPRPPAPSRATAREWSIWRYRDAAVALERLAEPGASLVDLGCGSGNVLAYLHRRAPLGRLLAVDPDAEALAAVGRQVGCDLLQASLLDRAALREHEASFDFAVLGDVLHHLVAASREGSRRLARQGLENAAALLRPGGVLFLLEPTFRPQWLAATVFHLKRAVSRCWRRRLELGAPWANLGPPVVSLLDARQWRLLARSVDALELEAEIARPSSARWTPLRRGRLTLVLRRR
jgi:SAM-dependent methyltransferase